MRDERFRGLLLHGVIEISDNQVENATRPIVDSRKNWLFYNTQDGANASMIVFTVQETVKANGLNPEAYLNHASGCLSIVFCLFMRVSVR